MKEPKSLKRARAIYERADEAKRVAFRGRRGSYGYGSSQKTRDEAVRALRNANKRYGKEYVAAEMQGMEPKKVNHSKTIPADVEQNSRLYRRINMEGEIVDPVWTESPNYQKYLEMRQNFLDKKAESLPSMERIQNKLMKKVLSSKVFVNKLAQKAMQKYQAHENYLQVDNSKDI